MAIQVSHFKIQNSVFHGIRDMKWELRAEFVSALDARSWLGSWIRRCSGCGVGSTFKNVNIRVVLRTDQIGSNAGRVSSVVVLAIDSEAI
ncbi:hypothetical protein Tco_0901135 [Tanacetum coccineum]